MGGTSTTGSTGAVGTYAAYVQTASSYNVGSNAINITSATLSGLTAGTYYIAVWAIYGTGQYFLRQNGGYRTVTVANYPTINSLTANADGTITANVTVNYPAKRSSSSDSDFNGFDLAIYTSSSSIGSVNPSGCIRAVDVGSTQGTRDVTLSGYSSNPLEPGETYWVVPWGIYGSGGDCIRGSWSTVTMLDTPGTPRSVSTALAGSGSVTVNWLAPTSDGGSDITGYTVTAYTTSTGTYASGGRYIARKTVGSSARSVTFDGLTNGTTYYFRVMASNDVGNGTESGYSSKTPYTTPAPVTITNTPVVGSGMIRVSWHLAAQEDTTGGPTNIYVYAYTDEDSTSTTSYAARVNAAATDTSATLSGLKDNTRYYFRVRLINPAGEFMSQPRAATAYTAPKASVTSLQCAGSGTVKATFRKDSDSGTVATYAIFAFENASDTDPSDSVAYSTVYASSNTFETRITGLENGKTYYFRARAVGPGGDTMSSGYQSITTWAPPDKPTNIQAVPTGNDGELQITWTTPNDSGTEITSVSILNASTTLKTITKNGAGWSSGMATAGTTCSTTLSGLETGRLYRIKVAVTTAGGTTTSTEYVDVSPKGAPTPPVITADGTGTSKEIAIKWTTPDDNGYPITGMWFRASLGSATWEYSINKGDEGWTESMETPGAENSYIITLPETGPDDGREVSFIARASSEAGQSWFSNTAKGSSYTKADAPVIQVVNGATNHLQVVWTAERTGGRAITLFEIYQVDGPNGTVAEGQEPVSTLTLPENHTATVFEQKIYRQADGSAFEENTDYYYVVRGKNAAGYSDYSAVVSGQLYHVPTAPTIGTAMPVDGSGTSAIVSWKAPDNLGNATITSYIVNYNFRNPGVSGENGEDGSREIAISDFGADNTSADYYDEATGTYYATITGLKVGANYRFTVQAVNEMGTGAASTPAATTLNDQPPAREVKILESASRVVTVGWNVDDAESCGITGYKVAVYEIDGEGENRQEVPLDQPRTIDDPATDRLRFTGLTNGQLYAFYVTAINPIGESVPARVEGTASSYPSAPNVTASTDGVTEVGVIRATWPETSANGSAIRSYTLEVRNNTTEDVYARFEGLAPQGSAAEYDNGGIHLKFAWDNDAQLYRAEISGLEERTAYRIAVQGVNDPGAGAWGISTATALGAPEKVKNVAATPTGTPGAFVVDWTDGENGGKPITTYRILIFEDTYIEDYLTGGVEKLLTYCSEHPDSTAENTFWQNEDSTIRIREITAAELQRIAEGDPNYTLWQAHDLNTEAGKTFRVRVQAMNELGAWSTASDPVEVKAYGVPKDISELTAEIQEGGESIKFLWKDPKNTAGLGNGGRDILGYAIKIYQQNEDGDFINVSSTFDEGGNDLYSFMARYMKNVSGDGYDQDDFQAAMEALDENVNFLVVPRKGAAADVTAQQSFAIDGLESGETYYAEVYPFNMAGPGNGKESDQATLWALPGTVQNLKAFSNGNSGELTVTWDAPEDLGNRGNNQAHNLTEILTYYVCIRPAEENNPDTSNYSAIEYTDFELDEDGHITYTIGELTNGVAYQIYVIPENGKGPADNDACAAGAVTATPASAPGAPIVSGISSGNASAIVKDLQIPADCGGSAILRYEIYAQQVSYRVSETGATEVIPVDPEPVLKRSVSYVGEHMTDITIPDLVNGNNYRITVRAVNGTGNAGKESEARYVLVGRPETPRDFKLEPGEPFRVIASADGTGIGNGNDVLYYYAYVNNSLTPYTENGVVKEFTDPSHIEIVSNRGGNPITVQLSAVNRIGESDKTEPLTVIVGAPTSPELISVTVGDDNKATVTWKGSTDNGIAMSGYRIYLKEGESGAWTAVGFKDAATLGLNDLEQDQTYTYLLDQTLQVGTLYTIKVNGVNAMAEGPDSRYETFTIGVPGAPDMCDATEVVVGSGELTIHFAAPENTGLGQNGEGSGTIAAFHVYANNSSFPKATITKAQIDLAAAGPADGETKVMLSDDGTVWYENGEYYVKLTGLANGSTYRIWATAENAHGSSAASAIVRKAPATVPDAPRSIEATATSNTKVDLSWKAPLYNGGATVTSYQICVLRVDGPEIYTPLTDAQGHQLDSANGYTIGVEVKENLTASVSGLKEGETYCFEVRAVNSQSAGEAGRSNEETTFYRPSAPTNLALSAAKDSTTGKYNMTVTWEAPEDNGGTPITGYRVWIGSTAKSGDGLLRPLAGKNSFIITGLDPVEYTVRVEPFNAVCVEGASRCGGGGTCAQASLEVGRIPAPQNLKAVETEDGGLTLSWDAVDETFFEYRIYDLSTYMQDGRTLAEAKSYVESQQNLRTSMTLTNDGTLTRKEFHLGELQIDDNTHYYVVGCYNAQGTGGYLSEACEYTRGSEEPLNITEVKGGLNSIDLTFDRVDQSAFAENVSLLGYQILLNGVPFTGKVYMDDAELTRNADYSTYASDALNTGTGSVTLQLRELEGDQDYSVSVRAMTLLTEGGSSFVLPGQIAPAQTVTVFGYPPAPQWVSDQSGNQAFDVTFRPVDQQVAGYAVFLEVQDGEELKWVLQQRFPVTARDQSTDTLTKTVTNVPNGYRDSDTKTAYRYYVASYVVRNNEYYDTACSEELIHSIVNGIPAAPEILSTNIESRKVTLSYSAPTMAPGLEVSSYVITLMDEDENVLDTISNITSTTHTVNLPADGIPYKLTVQAVNSIGAGIPSDVITVTGGVPSTPVIVDYAVGDKSISLRWDTAILDNGSPLQCYRVYYTDTEDNSRYVKNVDVNENSVTLPDLKNGVTYRIEVVAVNGNGESLGAKLPDLVPGTVPGSPRNLSATPLSSSSIQINWMAPESDGGMPIDLYRITYRENGADVFKNVLVTDPALTLDEEGVYHYTISPLREGVEYTFTVQAHNGRDYSKITEETETVTATTLVLPGQPQWKGLSSVNYSFTVEWAEPRNTGGTEITGYYIYADGISVTDGPIAVTNENLTRDEDGVYSYTVSALANGDPLRLGASHQISVAAVNSVGTGDPNSSMKVVIQGPAAESVPGRPGTPAVESGNGQLKVTWTAPLIEGVIQGISGYTVYCRAPAADDGQQPEPVTAEITGRDTLTHTFTGLTNGTEYTLWVVAKNRIGSSDPSSSATGTPEDIAAPTKPQNVKYQNNGTMNVMTISWDASTGPEVGGEISYEVYVNDTTTPMTLQEPITSYTVQNADGSTVTRYKTSMEVQGETLYNIWVVAKNLGGSSELNSQKPDAIGRNWLNVETTGALNAEPNLNLDRDCDGELDEDQIQTKPTAPTGLKATVGESNDITLTWNIPTREGSDEIFSDITQYKIYQNGTVLATLDVDSGDVTVDEEHQTCTWKSAAGVLADQNIYSFQVSAVNDQGEGDGSEPLQLYIQSSAVGAPTELKATLGDENGADHYTKVTLKWTAPIGKAPKHYVLQINGVDYKDEADLISGDATSITWPVEPNQNYVFRLYSVGEDGSESKTTPAVSISTILDAPNAPILSAADVENAETGDGKIVKLTWTEVPDAAGYYLYVNGTKFESAGLLTSTAYNYPADADIDLTFTVTAVNQVGTAERESTPSNAVLVSTADPDPEAPAAPGQPTITGVGEENGRTVITLQWPMVTATVGGGTLTAEPRYTVYVSKDNGAFTALDSASVNQSGSNMICRYQDTDMDGHDYTFQVRAEITAEDGSTLKGPLSLAVSTSTKNSDPLPAVPENLRAEVNDGENGSKVITLYWNPVADPTLRAYAIYVDSVFVAEITSFNTAAPSYQYTVDADDARDAFFFQVAAVNGSENTNSMDQKGYSELSDGLNVSLDGDINQMPPAAAAPEIVKSVQRTIDGETVIRMFWKAPTKDVRGNDLPAGEVTDYQINITKLNSDGTTTEIKKTVTYTPTADDDGLLTYDIPVDDAGYPIELGSKYAVTITALRYLDTGSEAIPVPGASKKPWIIMQNLNVDNDDDWDADLYPDADGDGIEDATAGTLVKVSGTVFAGGSSDAPTIEIRDESGTLITALNPGYDGDSGQISSEFRLTSSSGKYAIRVTKPGCTWFEITEVPLGSSLTNIDLNALLSGYDITLFAGDVDGDGRIAGSDLSTLLGNFGLSDLTLTDGDLDGDGRVAGADLSALLSNFGNMSTTINWNEREGA